MQLGSSTASRENGGRKARRKAREGWRGRRGPSAHKEVDDKRHQAGHNRLGREGLLQASRESVRCCREAGDGLMEAQDASERRGRRTQGESARMAGLPKFSTDQTQIVCVWTKNQLCGKRR